MTAPSDKPRTYNGNLKNLPPALEPLTALPYWVLWRWEKRKGKWTKPPYQPNGQKAKSDDPATWSTYDEVIAVVDQYDGIGFMLPEHATPDLDGCRTLNTGASQPWASQLIDKSKTYVEISPSGKGFKVIGLAAGDNVQKKWPIGDGTSLEAYRRTHRYTTITGNQLPGTPQHLANIDAVVDEVYAEHEGRRSQREGNGAAAAEGASLEGAADLPPMLASLLHIPNLGAGKSRGESRAWARPRSVRYSARCSKTTTSWSPIPATSSASSTPTWRSCCSSTPTRRSGPATSAQRASLRTWSPA